MKSFEKITKLRQKIVKYFFPVDPVKVRSLAFEKKHGYTPNFYEPKTFSEKLNARILFEDDPYYLLYATKLFAPYYAAQKVKEKLCFPKRFKVKIFPEIDDFDDLPNQFIMKSSFGSGLNKIVWDKSSINAQELCDFFRNSLRTIKNAKGHTLASNCVIFEELLLNEKQQIPSDFKFHCFWRNSNTFKYILEIISERFSGSFQTLMDENNDVLDFTFGNRPRPEKAVDLPPNFSDMVDVAKSLSRGFSYIRVDLFRINDAVYFGELTPFHSSGWAWIPNRAWDYRLGEMWKW